MFIIKHRKIFFTLSVLLVAASVFTIFNYGLRFGLEFTGGTIVEIEYPSASDKPALEQIHSDIKALNLGQFSLQEIGTSSILLRLRNLLEDEHESLKTVLGGVEKRYSSIGPALGQELTRRGLWALLLVVALIIIYIAFVFRRVSRLSLAGHKGVSSWKYGLIAILALVHDVSIPTGVMAVLGHFYLIEADALFLTALLTILGLSVNDTIVVFDRIRENLRPGSGERFDEVVGRSLRATIARSIITSLTVILVLLAVYFFGGATTKYFALIMAIGMFIGTYSSIFIAAPLLVSWQKFSERVK